MLEVRALAAGYGAIQILWDVNLEVGSGEVVAMVGPNGAGKTTLINTLSGMVEQTGGTLHFDGRDLSKRGPEARVAAGLIQCPEGRRLFPEMTVEENLRMGAYLCRDGAEVARRIAEVRRLFPILAERATQVASTLSGGQQQMVALGRALMAKPKLLLLDEPSLGLAPIIVSELFEAIARIRQRGVTVLIVEQNVVQTLRIADRAYVLENGRIALRGVARELLEHPHMKTAYLGA